MARLMDDVMQKNMRAEKTEYHPLKFYEEYVAWYGAFAPYVGMCLCAADPSLKQSITCNFVSRAAVSLRGIIALWQVHDYQDCWVAYRCLLDRLFHLHFLNRTDNFKEFADWSFLQQYHARNAIRSSPLFKDKIDPDFFRDSEADKARAKALSEDPPEWTRPGAETEARDMNLEFLYKQGYDYASTLVHPMANDGRQDYTTVSGNGGPWPDQTVVVNNSCLAGLLLLQEAMGGSARHWHRLVQECMDEALQGLTTGSRDYLRLFVKLGKAVPDGNWCEPPRPEERDSGSA